MDATTASLVFGPNGARMFAAMMFFLLLGALLRKIVRLHQRKPSSHSSPRKFHLAYWLRDNWADMAIGFIIAFVLVRFPAIYIEPAAKALFPSIPADEILLVGSLLVGFCIDIVAERLSKILKLKA